MQRFIWFFQIFLLENSRFTVLGQFQVYSKVNQSYVYIHPLCFRFFSHAGHYRVLTRVRCAIQQLLMFYIQQCVYVNTHLLIHGTNFCIECFEVSKHMPHDQQQTLQKSFLYLTLTLAFKIIFFLLQMRWEQPTNYTLSWIKQKY